MGYATSHELEISDNRYELIEFLREECEDAKWALDENGGCYDSCKWYDHEKDLRAFSAKHADVLFTLSGEGEESGDIWIEYYKSGLMQHCKARITFDTYDESRLS